MILKHYGLSEQPFGATPDPRFLFPSKMHKEALASLLYAIESGRGFTALIAPPGLGKTTLLFQLLGTLGGKAKTAFVFQTQCKPRELLRFLLKEFGVTCPKPDFVAMHHALNDMLAAEALAGRKCIIVLDEAHNLSDSALESIRLLSDFETPNKKLLHIILAGQSELSARLSQPSLEQLRQRIGVVCKLGALAPKEIDEYIQHRLNAAGYGGSRLFTPAAMAIIREFSRGIPRNINALCFSAMSLGFALGRTELDAQVLEEAVADLSLVEVESQDRTEIDCSSQLAPASCSSEPVSSTTADSVPACVSTSPDESLIASLSAAAGADASVVVPSAPIQSIAVPESAEAEPIPTVATDLSPTSQEANEPAPLASAVPDPLRNIDLSGFALLDGLPAKKKDSPATDSVVDHPWIPAASPILVTPEPELDALKERLAAQSYPQGGSSKVTKRDYVVVGLVAAVAATALLAALLWARPNIGFAMGHSPEQAPEAPATVSENQPPVPHAPRVGKKHTQVLTFAGELKAPARRQNDLTLASPEEVAPVPVPLEPSNRSRQLEGLISEPNGAQVRGSQLVATGNAEFNNPIVMVPPIYPESAKQNKLEGTVVLQIVVDKNGRVKRLERVGGDPDLADAAMKAVRQWRYQPYVVNGKREESSKQLEMRFSLGSSSSTIAPQ
jgi:TonB family protein